MFLNAPKPSVDQTQPASRGLCEQRARLYGRRGDGWRLDSLFSSPSASGSNNQLQDGRSSDFSQLLHHVIRTHTRAAWKKAAESVASWACSSFLQGGGGREGGRQRRKLVLISANKGVLWPFSLCFVSKRPWRSEVLASPRLLSPGWQKGPVWNPSRQVEEWRRHRVSRSVFTFCLFTEWRHGHLFLSPSSLHLPTSLSFFFHKLQ